MTCLDYGEDEEQPLVFASMIVKARKNHKCCECGEEITTGEKYEVVKGLWDFGWGTFKTCEVCCRIRKDLCKTWIYGELREVIKETFGIDYVKG